MVPMANSVEIVQTGNGGYGYTPYTGGYAGYGPGYGGGGYAGGQYGGYAQPPYPYSSANYPSSGCVIG